MRLNTAVLHGQGGRDQATGSPLPPVAQVSAFAQPSAEQMERVFQNKAPGFAYTRLSNPTVSAFEQKIAALEGGVGAVACASGMAAVSMALLNVLQAGDEFIATSRLYGGTLTLFHNFEHFGMAVDYAALKAGGFMRQKQKDTFSLRLRVVGGTVTTEQLVAIQKVADKYGHGYIHLTSRQGVEIPFIKLQDIDAVKAALAEGNVSPGVCGPRVRTVTACQAGRCCPSGCIDALDIAEKLDARYFGRQLPHKFKFGVTGCQNNCLKAEENDFGVKGGLVPVWNKDACIFCGVCEQACRTKAITIKDGESITIEPNLCNFCGRCVKACPTEAWQGRSGFMVSFGGTFGNSIQKGKELLPIIEDEETLLRVADAAIDFFAEFANPGERFAKTLDRVGWDKLKEKVEAAYHG